MNGFGTLVAITLVIVAVSLLLLGVQTFFSKRRRFPHTHVGGNKALAKKGVFCVQTQDALERRKSRTVSTDESDAEDISEDIE